ncbi:uncharacterized protein HaLaN_09129, partial [Haematococcus lacustris]
MQCSCAQDMAGVYAASSFAQCGAVSPRGGQGGASREGSQGQQPVDSTGKLDLSDCGLASLPPEVLQLTQLEDLSLAGNQLSSLPPGISGLTQLRRLGLAGNRLVELPRAMGDLIHLQ